MPIDQQVLRNAAQRAVVRKSLAEGQATAFLCHSHKDRELAEGLQVLLREAGLDLYIDWQDTSMPEKPTRETAERLQQRILRSDWFLFLATTNSTSSRWCPWELGYADGKKSVDRIAVVPTRDSSGFYHGNEYLELYRRIDVSTEGALISVQPRATTGIHVREMR
jgi:hypothetical protein